MEKIPMTLEQKQALMSEIAAEQATITQLEIQLAYKIKSVIGSFGTGPHRMNGMHAKFRKTGDTYKIEITDPAAVT